MSALLSAWLIAAILVGASVLVGGAILRLAGQKSTSLLAGGIGFAALVTVAQPLIGLPGRVLTGAIVIGIAVLAAAAYLWRAGTGTARWRWVFPAVVAVTVALLGSTPFLFSGHVGILGEGIYTNDLAAQLYWTDWLQRGAGPEPQAVGFGYPFGPQSLTAIVAEATGVRLDAAFNGLLLAIPMLTAISALALVRRLAGWKRFTVAVLTALPYLAASFLAQSAFKETAMGLFVVVLAITLQHSFYATPCEDEPTDTFTPRHEDEEKLEPRALVVMLVLLATASVVTFSLPGLAWIGLILPLWLFAEVMLGGRSIELSRIGRWIRDHRVPVAIGIAILAVIAIAVSGSVISFIEKIGVVQESRGRLRSPVFFGEAFGLWPEGDFQLVRGDVTGSEIATLVGAVALAAGAWVAWCRYRYGILSALLGCVLIYLGSRIGASFYVSAKALAIMAPLIMLVTLSGLLIGGSGRWARAGVVFGTVFAIAAFVSTLLAMRAAPVGYPERGHELERLAKQAEGETLVFLGVDRFAAWWLRDARTASPGGYLPETTKARDQKAWQQGWPMDFDTPKHLDRFEYAITTAAPYQSSPAPGFEEVDRTGSYVLWRRGGEDVPRWTVVPKEGAAAGVEVGATDRSIDGCANAVAEMFREEDQDRARRGVVISRPGPVVVAQPERWTEPSPQRAPSTNSMLINNLPAGTIHVSLQYHSQVELVVRVDGKEIARLGPSLVGMYLTRHGQSAFWPAGTFEHAEEGPVAVEVEALAPTGIERALGGPRNSWLGRIAFTRFDATTDSASAKAAELTCDGYVDRVVAARTVAPDPNE